jgi:NADP-dependent 3-hydroxy acid dehydrogenase YdfG
MSVAPIASITGGSSGIGAATGRLLDVEHWVTVMGRDTDRLKRFAAEAEQVAEAMVR